MSTDETHEVHEAIHKTSEDSATNIMDGVKITTGKELEKETKNSSGFVVVWSSTCPHCFEFAKIWNPIIVQFSTSNLKFLQFEYHSDTPYLTRHLHVKELPTVYRFTPSGQLHKMPGPYNHSVLIRYFSKLSPIKDKIATKHSSDKITKAIEHQQTKTHVHHASGIPPELSKLKVVCFLLADAIYEHSLLESISVESYVRRMLTQHPELIPEVMIIKIDDSSTSTFYAPSVYIVKEDGSSYDICYSNVGDFLIHWFSNRLLQNGGMKSLVLP